jgi:UDP-N-acetyl-D-galactosamine dehydrogenase
MNMNLENKRIAVIGLGYVGLPLAVAFAEKYLVFGYDLDKNRVRELNNYNDRTFEIGEEKLKDVLTTNTRRINSLYGLIVNDESHILKDANIFIVTVPTPTDHHNRPVLTPMIEASKTVSTFLKKGDIVIYESTVYPGVTEEEMVPILEKYSGMKYNKDFFCGYSPERINPGDKLHTFKKIMKITSGSNPEVAELIDMLYSSVIEAGTYKAASIKVAEAAKVIENAQRDINIAFINELSIIFNLLGIDTYDVLEAASTKWNFLNFRPGLVGGHCIGVDPYYLAQKAKEVGHHPEIILAGRRLNNQMGKYVAQESIKMMVKQKINLTEAKALILGITFKENCPDIRNTKVVDIIHELNDYNFEITIVDPNANSDEVKKEYNLAIYNSIPNETYDLIILAVAHDQFLSIDFNNFKKQKCILFDIKGVLDRKIVNARL